MREGNSGSIIYLTEEFLLDPLFASLVRFGSAVQVQLPPNLIWMTSLDVNF